MAQRTFHMAVCSLWPDSVEYGSERKNRHDRDGAVEGKGVP